MVTFMARRLVIAVPTLLISSLLIFAILALAPGDPMAEFTTNPEVPLDLRAQMQAALGIDRPWPVRYGKWLVALAHGDWGFSFTSRGPVIGVIAQRIPQTLWVVGLAYLVSTVIGIPLGIIAAVKHNSVVDHCVTVLAFVGRSLPPFVSAVLLILIFGVKLHWLPFIYDTTLRVHDLPSFGHMLKQIVMPITVLALAQIAAIIHYMRAALLDTLPLDYVRTARAKGLSMRSVILRHALINSLIPVITLIALGIPSIFTGAIVVEQIFHVNGLGELLVRSIQSSDTPMLMGLTFIYAILVVLFNLIADVLYGVLDPRIRYP